MRRRAGPIALGLAAAAVAILIVSNRTDRYTVQAEFSDVRGLVSGAQVRLAGVPVGSVGRIWLGRDGWPHVQLSIDRDVSLRSSARAAVLMSSLSSEWGAYVSVIQGAGAPLPGDATIPRSHTTSPVEVDEALSTFDPKTRGALTQILAGLKSSLAGQGPALAASLSASRDALTQIANLAGAAGADGTALQVALRSTHEIAATLAARRPELDAAVQHTAALLETVAGRASAIRSSLAGLPAGLDAAHGTLVRARTLVAPTDRLLDTSAPALAQLPAASGELQTALQAARPALAKAAEVATEAPAAAEAMKPVLNTAGTLLQTMIPVLGRIGPMLDQLRVRLPDAFSFFANWADFTSNYDANGHAARVGIVLPPAPTNVLSPSSDGAGQLAPPYLRTPGSLEGQPWTDYWKSFVDGGQPGPDVK
jgi:phospholipid/cholesterol/gamma-HCH transport system substrate-binding protein